MCLGLGDSLSQTDLSSVSHFRDSHTSALTLTCLLLKVGLISSHPGEGMGDPLGLVLGFAHVM